ncbi:hypothetical protein GCM10022419_121240 [Nonomuraea rosea]|uniref:PE domain-containing protein n=2 Tax=Nonomuraea rosea TaxID=638574 RepID=A0ABP6ZSU1_9ACTN
MATTNPGWHLEQHWPGLVADRDEVMYDPKLLGNVADALHKKLSELTGVPAITSEASERTTVTTDSPAQGSLPDVEQHRYTLDIFASQLEDVKKWEGGDTFAAALRQGHAELTKVYKEVNEKLAIAFALIDAGAGNYRHANVANEG